MKLITFNQIKNVNKVMITLVMLPSKMKVQEEVVSEILISHHHFQIFLKISLVIFLIVAEKVEVEKIQTIEDLT